MGAGMVSALPLIRQQAFYGSRRMVTMLLMRSTMSQLGPMAAGSNLWDCVIWSPNSSRSKPFSHPCKGIYRWLATFHSAWSTCLRLSWHCSSCASHPLSFLTTLLKHCRDCLYCPVHNTLIQNSVGSGLCLPQAL